jgi:hypothetical protein
MAKDSITRLTFVAAMLAATTLWMAERPAVTDQSDPLNASAAPLRFTLATRAADVPSDDASDDNAGEESDDSSPRRPVPLLSADTIATVGP